MLVALKVKELEIDEKVVRNLNKYSGLMKNDSCFKDIKCFKKSTCWYCPLWKAGGHCEGPKNNKLTAFEKQNLKGKVGKIIMENSNFLEKTQLIKDAYLYFGIPESDITTAKLFNYQKRGLIDYQGKKGNPLSKGSISLYAKNTPGLLYLIENLQKQGYQLAEIKDYLDLIKLNDIEKIKNILREHRKFEEEMLLLIGIDKEIKEYIIKNVPLNLFNYEKILTKLDHLKKVIQLRAYAELDYRELTSIIIANADKIIIKGNVTKSIFNDILDNPDIEINIDTQEIKVIYPAPVNKQIIFKQAGLVEVI